MFISKFICYSIYQLLILTVLFPELLCVHPLHRLVKEYQTIHKDDVRQSWKRSPTLLEPVRVVRLLLWRQVIELHVSHNHDLFHPMAIATEIDESGNSKQHPINAHQFYIGKISDDATSRVKLHVTSNGILTASITTENDVIYIEPASRFLDDSENMFVYNRSKLIPKNTQSEQFCALKDDDDVKAVVENQLRRRQTLATSAKNNNTDGRVCLMHLVSDYRFFKFWGGESISSTIISLANVVETADFVFRNTVWEPGLTNLGLQVGNITIYSTPGCVSYNQPNSPTGRKWTAETLLQEFSYNDWRLYCLAHLFTDQTFDTNALGLAYVSNQNPSLQGGICSRYSSRLPGGDPSRPGTANVGFSSFGNLHGKQLLQPEAEHIFTHEVGHNWGSQHDLDTPECNPPFGKNGGKYIMYASVLSGNEPNNKRFSNCSKRWIARVLRSRSSCFEQRAKSLCGNYRVDPGEECDEGLENFGECVVAREPDACCNDNCMLKVGANCSDRNHPCCQKCLPAQVNSILCYQENDIDCLQSVYCDGVHSYCPLPPAKLNGSSCSDDGLCLVDEADNITCQTYCRHMYNMEPCVCPSDSVASDSRECYYCCLNVTDGVCRVALPIRQLPNGRPCEGGVCIDGHCMLRNADLSTRLYNFLQSLTSDTLGTLIRENVVGTIIILSLIPYTIICILICCMDRHTERKYAPLVRQVIRFVKQIQLQQKSRENSTEATDHSAPLI